MRKIGLLAMVLAGWLLWPALSFPAPALGSSAPPVLSSGDAFLAFQGDPAHDGVVSDDSIRPPLVEKWSVYLGMPGINPQVSFPIIVGGRVFVTAWGNDNYAYALDLRTGRIDWGPVDIGPGGHWSSLTYDQGRLFVTDSNGDLVALDPATGTLLWADTGAAGDDSPTAVGGVLYSGPNLQAFNETTGQLEWTDSGSRPTGMPAISGETIYTAGVDDNLVADTLTGRRLWSYEGPDTGYTALLPVVSDGQVFVRSPTVSSASNVYPGWIHSASSGSGVGTFNSFSVPAADADRLYSTVSTESNDSAYDTYELEAVNRSTGGVAWAFDGDNQLDSSPLVANGTVYEGSWGQDLYALDAATGRELWSTALGAAVPPSNETQDTGPLSGLGIGGGYLVVPTEVNGSASGPTLTAFGPAGAAGTLDADSVQFAPQPAGTVSQGATITLTDTGAAPLTVGQATLAGSDPSSFTLSGDGCSGTTLAPGAACTVDVSFAPESAGEYAATLSLPGSDGASHPVALAGQGTGSSSAPPPPPPPGPGTTAPPAPNAAPMPAASAPAAGTPAPTAGTPAPALVSAAPARAILAPLRADRSLIGRTATLRALETRGHAAVMLRFPAAGTLVVELLIPGSRAARNTSVVLARQTLGRAGVRVTVLRLPRADRRALLAAGRRARVLLLFRPLAALAHRG